MANERAQYLLIPIYTYNLYQYTYYVDYADGNWFARV